MSKKTVMVAAGVLLVAGAVAAVAHGGRSYGRMGGDDMGGSHFGRGHGGGEHGGRMGHRGGRNMTAEDWDTRTRERFARLDANSDGVIDATEAEAAMSKRGERHRGKRGERHGTRMLQHMGADETGKLTKAAFDAFVDKKFAEMDLTNDGKIDDADLPPMMRGRGALSGEGGTFAGRGRHGGKGGGRMLGMVREADANKDGVITKDEVTAAAGKRFARLDTNSDGTVDQADFDKMRSDMVAYRVQRFMHRYGADQDQKVTREQFQKVAKERFAMRDSDGDGRMEGRREHRGGGHHGGRGRDRGPMMERGPGAGPGAGGDQGPGPGSGPGPGQGPGGPNAPDTGGR